MTTVASTADLKVAYPLKWEDIYTHTRTRGYRHEILLLLKISILTSRAPSTILSISKL